MGEIHCGRQPPLRRQALYIGRKKNDDGFQFTPLGVILMLFYIVGNSIFIILFFYVLVFLIIFKPARMFNYTK